MATTRRRRSLASGGTTTPPPSAYYRAATPPPAASVAMIMILLTAAAGGGGALHVGAAMAASAASSSRAVAGEAAATVPVRVGVILDLATALGKKGLLSLEMALEDFYAAHPNFTTRVELHVRDSDRDVVTAASAVVDLICIENISIVIGTQNILQAEFITYLANKTKVPVISFSATRDAVTQYHVPYFVRACVKDSFQAASIAAFVKAYGWKNVVIVYEDNDCGVGILPSITDALQSVETHVIYRSAIPASSPNSIIDLGLYKLMTMQTRVFIVHMLPARASRFFARASAAGMMTEGYVWIVTDNVGISLDVLPQHTIETMQGVVGFRPYVAKSARNIDFVGRFIARIGAKYHQHPNIRIAKPTIYQFWAYDVAWAVAIATEKVKRFRFSNICFQMPEGMNRSLIDTLLPSPVGPEVLGAILETDFDGLAGRFTLVDRHMQVPVYEIVNVIGDQAKGIGFWSPASGLLRILNSSTSHGQTNFSIDAGEIQWPGGSKMVPKGWDLPVNGKILRIGVPIRHAFNIFMSVDTIPGTNTVSVSGYSIDVFEAAVKKLPYALHYNYIPFDCANSYDKLVTSVYLKEFDAAVGDVTIIANRATDVDFTMPYTESGVSMLVLAKNNDKLSMWIFLEPLTNDLWIATTIFIFFTGLVVWMSEYPTNEEFQGSRLKQFSTAFYFIFSTLTFSHDQIIRRLPSKVLVVIWCFVVLTLVQSYTASLSSLLTAKRLQPSVTGPSQLLRNGDYVGYQNGSFVLAKLKQLKFDERKIKVFSTPEEYAKALRAGSNNGGVSAIFDEIPYLNTFLVQYGSEFQIVGHIDSAAGFGFVFPRGSPLVPDLSRAILDLREGHGGFAIQQKWFGDATPSLDYGGRGTDYARLSLKSFAGLFIINGFVLVIVLAIALFRLVWAYQRRSHVNGETVGDAEPQPLQDDMATNSVPAESLQAETIGDIGHQQLRLAIASVPVESLEVETRTS